MPSKKKKQPFVVRDSGIQGKGVFAVTRIRNGRRLIEYTGERISPEEEAIRYDDEAMERHHTFLFHIDEETTIDGAVGGNDSRFINHSCDPNCEAVDEEGRIYIEAIRTIHPGEELTYDYGFEFNPDEDDPEMISKYPCHCGAPNCRGTILNINSEDE